LRPVMMVCPLMSLMRIGGVRRFTSDRRCRRRSPVPRRDSNLDFRLSTIDLDV
jgi:hypothetical protein